MPGLVAGAAVGLLMTMAVVALGEVLSVDGCVSVYREQQPQAAQYERPTSAKPLVPGSTPTGFEETDRGEVGSEADQEQKVESVDCSELSETADRRNAVVTMRLTLFAAIGTFLFGMVTVFALLAQVRPADRD